MKKGSPLDELLTVSSESTSSDVMHESIVPAGLHDLYRKNGFIAFESALEVFPLGESDQSYSLAEWNKEETWRSSYKDLAPAGLCFAQDLFGMQFLIKNQIFSFDPETGETRFAADSIEDWAKKILADYRVLTGYPLAHAWQVEHGPIPKRARLVPITPFVLGGAYDVENLITMDAVEAMQLRANLALQIRNAPDGTEVIYEVR